MKKIFFLAIFLSSLGVSSQNNLNSFFKLSPPKRMWVLFHPFKAKKSLVISKETNRVADSIAKTNLLDKDKSGGQVDAFRHAYWMARLSQEIGERAARSLGKAHERENYLYFKENKLEDGIVPDEISSEMDLYNNEQGLQLISKNSDLSQKEIINKVVKAIKQGKMKIVKKDQKGFFLTCKGAKIDYKQLKGKWKNNKCLVFSN